jgi:hypothetical protein
LIASIGVLIAIEDGFRLLFGPYGLSFEDNIWFAKIYDLRRYLSQRKCRSGWLWPRSC